MEDFEVTELEQEDQEAQDTQDQFIKDTQSQKHRFYIDDNHLTQILTDWKMSFYDDQGNIKPERPRIPEAVGAAFWDMAEQMGKRHNFSQYTYLSEMKSDGILNCVKYMHNFNPIKKSEKKGKPSAYGYINMIIWRSFTNRIKYEKQQQYLKYKSFELMGGMDAFKDEELSIESGDEGGNVSISVIGSEFMNKIAEYERDNPDLVKKKKAEAVFDDFWFTQDDEEGPEEYADELEEMDLECV